MDYDKLIERLRKEAYGSDIEDLLLGASTAIETLLKELDWKDKVVELAQRTEQKAAAEINLLSACVYYKRGGLCRHGGCDPANVCVFGPCPHETSAEDVLADLVRLAAIEDILGDEYDLDRLRELAQADREGRCIVLPCKIGSTLYRMQRFKRGKNWRKEAEFIRTVELNRNNFWRIVMDGEIGKTVFLTRAEAQAALRREQDG